MERACAPAMDQDSDRSCSCLSSGASRLTVSTLVEPPLYQRVRTISAPAGPSGSASAAGLAVDRPLGAVNLGGAPAGGSGAPSSLSLTRPVLGIGVNFPRLTADGSTDTTFGTNDQILDDLVQLGVTYVRQPGELDLRWPLIPPVAPGTDGTTMAVPVHFTKDGARAAGLAESDSVEGVLEAEVAPKLQLLFPALHARGVKVVLTFLSLAGGSDPTSLVDPLSGTDAAISRVTILTWSESHLDNVLEDGTTFVDVFDSVPGVDPDSEQVRAWALATLDIRSRYKRKHIRGMAKQYAAMLGRLATLYSRLGVDIFDTILGIELFNEVTTSALPSPPGGRDFAAARHRCATWWGQTAVAVMEGFQDALDAGLIDRIPDLWFPSLASPDFQTDSPETELDATYNRGFDTTMVNHIADRAARYGLPLPVNQDVHWYRFDAADQGLNAITGLHDYVSDVATIVRAANPMATVSLSETGASVVAEAAAVDNFPTAYPQVPGPALSPSDAEAFQSREVVRRLLVAAAAGARHVGWHTHIAKPGLGFTQTGLRVDEHPQAVTAHQRRSYGIFRMLTDTLGFGTVVTYSEVLYPELGDYTRFVSLGLDPENVGDMLVITHHITVGDSVQHAYVLFVDSYCSDPDVDHAACVTIELTEAQQAEVEVWALAGGAGSVDGTRAYPTSDTWRAESAPLSGTSVPTGPGCANLTVQLRVYADPIVLVAPFEIGFTKLPGHRSGGLPVSECLRDCQ